MRGLSKIWLTYHWGYDTFGCPSHRNCDSSIFYRKGSRFYHFIWMILIYCRQLLLFDLATQNIMSEPLKHSHTTAVLCRCYYKSRIMWTIFNRQKKEIENFSRAVEEQKTIVG